MVLKEFEGLGAEIYSDMDSALEGADVVVSLRIKHEYMKDNYVPSLQEYTDRFFYP